MIGRDLYQCQECGNTRRGVTDNGFVMRPESFDCPVCGQTGTYARIPYHSGYDEPHLLNIWVRATSLERAGAFPKGGREAVKTTLRELEAVGIDSTDALRDLASAIELRLRELDTDLYRRMRDVPL